MSGEQIKPHNLENVANHMRKFIMLITDTAALSTVLAAARQLEERADALRNTSEHAYHLG